MTIRNVQNCIILVILLINVCQAELQAQTWQWGKRGGSPNSVGSGIPNESMIDLATDNHGNVYFLAHAKSPSYSFENTSLTGYGQQDLILGSVNCSGNLRWVKTLGGTNNDISSGVFHALAVSSLGHVYVGGFMSNPPQFDVDTLHPNTAKRLFLVQYDTSGNFQWLRMPQPDTVSQAYTNRYRFFDLEVDHQGNVFYFGTFNQGELAGTNTILPVLGPYIVKYDPTGNLVDVITPDMQIPLGTNVNLKFAFDPVSGRFYFSGRYTAGNFTIGNQPVVNEAFVVAFNSQGQLLWKRENSTLPPNNSGFFSKPAIDAQGNVYVSGTSIHGDIFNGYTVLNSMVSIAYNIPLIVKLDSNGNNIWAKNGSATGATSCEDLVLNNSEVVISGAYGRLIFPNEDTLFHAPNQGYDVYVGKFDMQTGVLTSLDSIASTFGSNDFGHALTSFGGSVYVGGELSSQLYVNGDTLFSVGGQSDFFIAKLGYPCGCVPPDADFSFTASSTSPQVNFLYTGSSNIDSLRWTFGDGNTSTASNPAHTYPGNGSYTTCLEVYNACGVDSICQTVVVNCPAPVPAFSFFQNGFTVNLSYTGSAADSLHWDLGDGQGASGLNPVHTYSQNGSYTVCVTAFNSCGSEDTCETVTILSVGELGGQSSFSVYPNPAHDRVIVEGLKSSSGYRLVNTLGTTVRKGMVAAGRTEIRLEALANGVYLLLVEGQQPVRLVVSGSEQ